MKQITTYINEKANFIVKKHVKSQDKVFITDDITKIDKGEYFKVYYESDNAKKLGFRNQMYLCKVYENAKEEERVYLEYSVDLSQRGDNYATIGGSFAYIDFEQNYTLKEPTDTELEIIDDVNNYLIKHKDICITEPKVMTEDNFGIIKDNKFKGLLDEED